MMHETILTGKIIQEPDIKYTSTGKTVCNFKIVVEENESDYHFIKCVAWEQIAQKLSDYNKGDSIKIKGYYKTNSWKNHRGEQFNERIFTVLKIKKEEKRK